MPRDYTIREHRLVTEWVELTYPRATYYGYRVRLGAFDPTLQDAGLTESELKALGIRRRWADAVVIDSDVAHLIEAKLTARPGPLEQLDLYAMLFPLTPELEAFRTLPIMKHLVWAVRDPVVESLARAKGIEVHYYHPGWVDDYFKLLEPRKVSPTAGAGFGRTPPGSGATPGPVSG
jgi:hypothetical protein